MNRAQRRHSSKVGNDLDPLLDLVEHMTPHAAFDDETGKPVVTPVPDARDVVARCPFRSILSKVWPPTIKDLWAVDPDCGAPPASMLDEMATTIAHGGAILLVSSDRATRDRCKQILRGWISEFSGGAG